MKDTAYSLFPDAASSSCLSYRVLYCLFPYIFDDSHSHFMMIHVCNNVISCSIMIRKLMGQHSIGLVIEGS